MQLGLPHRVHGHLDHSWGLLHKALLVTAAAFAALIACYVVYLAVVTAFILWA